MERLSRKVEAGWVGLNRTNKEKGEAGLNEMSGIGETGYLSLVGNVWVGLLRVRRF